MAFQFASTNLVIELGIILAVLIGWQFTAGEFVGGPIMIVADGAAVPALPDAAGWSTRPGEQAERGVLGRMEGHAEMDMSVARAARSGSGCARPQGSPRSATTS